MCHRYKFRLKTAKLPTSIRVFIFLFVTHKKDDHLQPTYTYFPHFTENEHEHALEITGKPD